MLVGDVPEDLLDDVLDGGDPGGAPVLVDHDGHGSLLPLEIGEEEVEWSRLGYQWCLGGDVGDRHRVPIDGVHGEGVLDMDDAADVVEILPEDGETGVTGLDRHGSQLGHRGGGRYPLDRHPGNHYVLGVHVDQGNSPRQHPELGVGETTVRSRRPDDHLKLLEGSDALQLLPRFHPQPTYRPVGRGVEERDQGTCQPVDQAHGDTHPHRHRIGAGDRQILGKQLPDDHLDDGVDDERRGDGHPKTRRLGKPECLDEGSEKGRHRRFGHIPEDE